MLLSPVNYVDAPRAASGPAKSSSCPCRTRHGPDDADVDAGVGPNPEYQQRADRVIPVLRASELHTAGQCTIDQ